MNEKLILLAVAVLNVLASYVVFLTLPEKFMFVLAFYITILGVGLVLAWSQEEKRGERRADAVPLNNK